MREITRYESLSGSEKTAVLILSIGESSAVRIFEHMSDDEIREISQAMAQLGHVSSDVVESLMLHFVEQINTDNQVIGNLDATQRLLSRVMDSARVDDIMEEIRGPAGRTMWEKLSNINEGVLANYLKNEYPQTVAVVLSKIQHDHSGKVLAALPDDFAMEVIMRMLKMEAVQKDILDDVERTLRSEFISTLSRSQRRDSHEMMAEIFNSLDRVAEQRLMEMLEQRDSESAERIRSLMFTFEDLSKLHNQATQVLLREVNKDRLVLALKGASEEMSDLFFRNMSERAGKILREDMQALGPVRLRDVEDAQQYMVNVARNLADRGEIVLAEGDDSELVY